MEKKSKKYKLNIFTVLEQADMINFDWYSNLSYEEKKGFVPLLTMRWMSSVGDRNYQLYYLCAINQYVNTQLWTLHKHPDLIWKLLCSTSMGKKQKHIWISNKTKKKNNKIEDFILSIKPNINEFELQLIKSRLNQERLIEIAEDAGKTKEEIKELIDEFKSND